MRWRATAQTRVRQAPSVIVLCLSLGCAGDPTDSAPTLAILPASETIRIPATLQLALNAPAGDVSWSSSDQTIAAVSASGVVKAKRPGKATITATTATQSASTTITVTGAKLEIIGGGKSIGVGELWRLAATLTDADGVVIYDTPIVWSTTNPAIATVDASTGVVKGIALGSTTILASGGGITATASVSVIVAPPRFVLTTLGAGDGKGGMGSNPAGIACAVLGGSVGGLCEAKFNDGVAVTITAGPAANSVFTGWKGDCTGLGACTVTMRADRSITATFALTKSITELPLPTDCTSGRASAISRSGSVAGTCFVGSSSRALGWFDGQGMRELGTLGGNSWSNGINDRSEIVGESVAGNGRSHPFFWRNGMLDLGVTPPVNPNSPPSSGGADAVNNDGYVVGYSVEYFVGSSTYRYATIWSAPGALQFLALGTGGLPSHAKGINSRLDVVGYESVTAGGLYHAFLTVNPRSLNSHTIRVGGIGATVSPSILPYWYGDSQANAINDVGDFVGQSTVGSAAPFHAVLWKNFRYTEDGGVPRFQLGQIIDLAPSSRDSEAFGINASGDIVGASDGRAVMWTSNGMVDLNTILPDGTGWLLTAAYGINNARQVVGEGVLNGKSRPFVLVVR